jgi:hypothetical protein
MKPKVLIACLTLMLVALSMPTISAKSIINVAPTPYSTYSSADLCTNYYCPSEILPPNGTKPPTIVVSSPCNNTVVKSNDLTLNFDLTLEAITNHTLSLQGLCYKPSWEPDNITVNVDSSKLVNNTMTFSVTFTNLTDGEKSITIYASALYQFETGVKSVVTSLIPMEKMINGGDYLYYYSNYYFTEGASSVNFTIDNSTTAPTSDFLAPIGVLAAIIAVVMVSLIYFKAHKKKQIDFV